MYELSKLDVIECFRGIDKIWMIVASNIKSELHLEIICFGNLLIASAIHQLN